MADISAGTGSGRDGELVVSRLRSRIEHVLDMSRDAFVETDAGGYLTEWNRQSEVLFGWSRDEVLGRLITDFLIPERHRRAVQRELQSMGSSLHAMRRTRPRQLDLLHREGYEVQVLGSAYIVGSGADLRIGGFLYDQDEDKAAEEALAHAYLHDSLTGLPNRTLFTYRLAYALAKGKSAPGSIAVLVLDLDRFKSINDGLGHEVGDEVLVAVAGRLEAVGESAEVIARLGGDEFLALFDGDDAEADAVAYAERSLQALSEPDRGGRQRGLHHRQHRGGLHQRPGQRGHAAALERRCRHVPGQTARGRDRRGLRRGHAHAGARPHEHRALVAPCPRAPRAPPLLPAGGGDQRGAGGGGRGVAAVGASRAGPRGPGPVHPRGRGERAHHPDRRLGAARGLSPAVHVAGRPLRWARRRGRGEPLGPSDRPSRDHLDGGADPRRHRAAAGQPDPRDHRERADERRRLGTAGAAGAQGARA